MYNRQIGFAYEYTRETIVEIVLPLSSIDFSMQYFTKPGINTTV